VIRKFEAVKIRLKNHLWKRCKYAAV